MRRKVTAQTVSRLDADMWSIICSQMHFSPHTVFRLMTASKAIRTQLGPQWWHMFYAKVLAYQNTLKHSNYSRSLVKLERVFGDRKQKLLKLVFSRQCCFCGKRFGHRMVPAFGIRACACLRDNVVSNVALECRYGVAFSDIIDESMGMLAFKAINLRSSLSQLTLDPYDHYFLRSSFRGLVCFFLKKDIEQRVELNETKQWRRRLAAQFLSARVARLLKKYPRREAPPTYWMPGGSYWALTRNFALVPRFDNERCARLRKTIEDAVKASHKHL